MPQITPDFEAEFDRAIASYADPGDAGYPLALASRVMAAVHARGQKRRWLLAVTVAVPALCCLLIVALLDFGRSEPQHRVGDVAAIPSPPHSAARPPALSPRKPGLTRHEKTRHSPPPLPKLDQFPTPAPMTEQERLLVEFVGRAPQHTQQSIAKTQKEADAPLRIAKLTIPKLDSETQLQ
jgi:hypothetical protein